MSKYYYSFRDNADAYSIYLSPQVVLGWFKLITAFLIIIFWRKIYSCLYNLAFYTNKTFTDNEKLIKYISSIQPNFKNAYSIKYKKSDRLVAQEEIQSELAIIEYKHLINRNTLIEEIKQLFHQYQQDIVDNNFVSIKGYTLHPFDLKQNNFDIIYDYNLSQIVLLKFEIREELKRFVVQINGQVINFKLSQKGYVISGQPIKRAFTEYWDIALDANNKCYLVTIY